MARPPRIDRADGVYHVTSRGNGRGDIFHHDDDRRRFLDSLTDNLETYGVDLIGYALMDNHFHLIVQTPDANLSAFMQRLKTAYALYARYKHRAPGHIFEGRFRAKLVEDARYLRQVSRYVHLNPVRTRATARMTAEARLEFLRGYRWSSYLDWVSPAAVRGDDPRPPVRCGGVLRQFSSRRSSARRAYRRYVESMIVETDDATRALMSANRYVIGSPEFAEETENELTARRDLEPHREDVVLPRRGVSLVVIDQRVACHYGVQATDLKRHGRSVGDAKAVAVELACRLSGISQRDIGAHYGDIRTSAVSKIRLRLRTAKTRSQQRQIEVVERLMRSLEHESTIVKG